jgi:2-keto-4-pentenoate hydratase/2-oxohepta-3-ene-1,7-dioic acid hydratase in catechol pathway
VAARPTRSARSAQPTRSQPWLKPGDRVRVEVDGIGAIENPVVQEDAADRALAA